MMVHICENTEQHLDYDAFLSKMASHRMKDTSSALGYAAVSTADNLNARCIVVPTGSGATARILSKFRPKTDLIAVSPNERCLRRMQIYWGVRSYKSIQAKSTEEICENAMEIMKAKACVETGDIAILTAGIPSPHVGDYGVSNMMRIVTVD